MGIYNLRVCYWSGSALKKVIDRSSIFFVDCSKFITRYYLTKQLDLRSEQTKRFVKANSGNCSFRASISNIYTNKNCLLTGKWCLCRLANGIYVNT